MHIEEIFNKIEEERLYQEQRWGHIDSKNTPYNWAAYITQYATRNLIGNPEEIDVEKFRNDMLKVATLAVAALQSIKE